MGNTNNVNNTKETFIEITRHEVPYGGHYETYKWVGDPRGVVCIDLVYFDSIKVLPWKLKQVEPVYPYFDPLNWRVYYVRTDVSFWWVEWLRREITNKLLRGWFWFYHRMLATAAVWGLADRHSIYAHIMSWRDLKIVQWIRTWKK